MGEATKMTPVKLDTILILDTETTGTDPAKDRIVEIGAVLWSVEHTCALSAWSELVIGDGNAAETINRIPAAALVRGIKPPAAMATLRALAGRADVVVAHNASFDRGFIGEDVGLPWVCSMDDLAWPRQASGTSLAATALAHDVGIVTAHRALADCLILARLLERVTELGHDVRAMLRLGLRPKATYQAMVSYADRELAKAAGFTWHGEAKRWTRRLAAEDVAGLPFKVVEVNS
jgi:DNA polymerase-3 subunit epsilon